MKRGNRRWDAWLLAGTLAAAWAMPMLAAPEGGQRGGGPGFATRDPRYRIQPSNVIELVFRFTPEFNQTVTVQPDGFISLLDVGELKVSGLTVSEIKAAVLEKYKGILNEPVVSVVLKEFSKSAFIVGGEVGRPGRFELQGETALTDAIAMAGGFGVGAKTSEVLLFRRVSAETVEVQKVNVKTALEKGQRHEDILLQPGDSIYVPRSTVGVIERFMSVSRLGFFFNPFPRW